METQRLSVDRKQARELYREYKKHRHYSAPIDREIQRIYQLIAQGRLVIRALESIKTAGLNEQGLPKLAIVRATSEDCFLDIQSDGGAEMRGRERLWHNRSREKIVFPAGTFSGAQHKWRQRAIVPLVPVHLRPKRGLQNYHILWEAEWTRIVPRDPMLLRRIGKADAWLVVAAWDLTPVEQAALAARLSA